VLLAVAVTVTADEASELARIEGAYADMNDAAGAVGLIDSGFAASHAGRNREAWSRDLDRRREEVRAGLATLADARLSEEDRRAVRLMREAVEPTRLHSAQRGALCLLRRAWQQHQLRGRAAHPRRGVRPAGPHRRTGAPQGAVPGIRPVVAGDQR
jgi:hypothetical protein